MKLEAANDHRQTVRAVLRHVRDRPEGKLHDLAEIAFLSPFLFHRVFKRLTGRTPAGHVRDLRLVRAAIALRTGRKRIVEIALEAEYGNHESFSRAFAREFGCSPREYRKKH